MYISDLVEGLVRLMDGNYTQPVNLVRQWTGREGEREGLRCVLPWYRRAAV